MAKHSKAKRKARKKGSSKPCEAGNKATAARTTSSAISEFEYVHQEEQLPDSEARVAPADVQSNETQTEGKNNFNQTWLGC